MMIVLFPAYPLWIWWGCVLYGHTSLESELWQRLLSYIIGWVRAPDWCVGWIIILSVCHSACTCSRLISTVLMISFCVSHSQTDNWFQLILNWYLFSEWSCHSLDRGCCVSVSVWIFHNGFYDIVTVELLIHVSTSQHSSAIPFTWASCVERRAIRCRTRAGTDMFPDILWWLSVALHNQSANVNVLKYWRFSSVWNHSSTIFWVS